MSSGCCATCKHFSLADEHDRRVAGPLMVVPHWTGFNPWQGKKSDGWCWWLTSHQGMVGEVPVWMLRGSVVEGFTRRVPMLAEMGADCYQWEARL